MTWLFSRRLFPGARLAALVLAAVGASLPVARPTVADSPPQRSSGHAIRKERVSTSSAGSAWQGDDDSVETIPRPVETWATLINVHTGEALALSSAEPSFMRFSDVLADRV